MREYKYTFEYYRYQLVPTKVSQLAIDNVPYTVEKLKEMKNHFFSEILSKVSFRYRDKDLPSTLCYHQGELFMLLLGNNKAVEYIEDFEKKKIKSDPFSIVVIDNGPDNQIIAIRNDSRAFSSADSIAKLLQETINRHLNYYNLEMHVEAISDGNDFWDAIQSSKNEVVKISFEIIKPNVSNISGALTDDIKGLIDKYHSHKTVLSMEASSSGQLININKNDKDMSSLADYTAKGGGRSFVKFKDKTTYDSRKHIKKKIQKTLLDLKNSTQEQLSDLIGKILK